MKRRQGKGNRARRAIWFALHSRRGKEALDEQTQHPKGRHRVRLSYSTTTKFEKEGDRKRTGAAWEERLASNAPTVQIAKHDLGKIGKGKNALRLKNGRP